MNEFFRQISHFCLSAAKTVFLRTKIYCNEKGPICPREKYIHFARDGL